ncbi:MAG: 50S ribosomal protein L15 [Gammaproteobacteria bacterium]|nr:50S ribosomal protein L15 [Gammaproteobacteria bacterium]NND40030.1 50S ribosomal protein L15 [Pseudomonadales bacterium]MBT8150455.1 50S ribosomal protein L15 [Gammaproteobacteria bacterium]NNL11772.1 50S ribosomal protein L15 [Pseudomonadales bacterium]NNM11285.1 50S ribosomal protein L15 [Pseudomonadales bacterium]
MRLNSIGPAEGHRKVAKRVGRGIGSGLGKTCGRGHKGQKSRSGGRVRPGFEGGQMPLQKRLPKYGFSSRIGRFSEQIRSGELHKVQGDVVDITSLKAAGLIGQHILQAKIFLQGDVQRAVTIKGLAVSKGAVAAIEAAGGRVES